MPAQVLTLTQDSPREEWLKNRNSMIGGSDASAILGMNPYKTNRDLYKEKIGLVLPEDISYKPYVKYGIEAEQHLTALFALDYPEYEVKANTAYMVYRHPQHPFIAGTLDGELVEKVTGRKGVLEIKTTEILRSMQWENWKEQIPMNYFAQVCHYLLATGWEFAILKVQLKTVYGTDVRLNTRHYHIERADIQKDLDYLLEKEIEFWGYVQRRETPPLVLPPL